VKTVADAMGVARSNLVERAKPRERKKRPPPADDAWLLPRIRELTDGRPSYGYRRTTALLNRELVSEGKARVNAKRIYRLMRAADLLLARYTGKSTRTHDGQVVTLRSDLRWCSDSFEIRCWNGERVQVAFSLDCCDREVMAYVATSAAITGEMIRDLVALTVERRYPGAATVPHPIEWLSDNGSPYTAYETRTFAASLGLLVRTTPAYSPESNGMAESFVKTLRRDYVYLSDLDDAETVMRMLPIWLEDYNEVHPHKGLKMQSPREYRRSNSTAQPCPV
jgi:transposase InsO family protein